MPKEKIDLYLNNLYKHTNSLIMEKEFDALVGNLDLFGDILVLILENSDNPTESKILKSWERNCDNLLDNMIRNNMQFEALEYVKKFYKINRENGVKFDLDFYDVFKTLIEEVKEENSVSKMIRLNIPDVLVEALLNTGNFKNKFFDGYLPSLYGAYYVSLYKNEFVNQEEKSRLIVNLFKNILALKYHSNIKDDQSKIHVVQNSLEIIIKYSIDLKDKNNFKSFLRLLSNENYFGGKIDINQIFIKAALYMYYLVEKEGFVNPQNKDEIKYLLRDNLHILNYQIDNIYNIWDYYNVVGSSISRWEFYDEYENGKVLILGGVTSEYFYYLSAVKSFGIDQVSEEVLNEVEVFSFLNRYTRYSKLTEGTIESYKKFKNLFGYSSNNGDSESELSNLHFNLMKRYEKNVFGKLEETKKNIEELNKVQQRLSGNLNSSLLDNEFLKVLKSEKLDLGEMKKIHLLSYTLDLTHLSEGGKFQFVEEHFMRKLSEVVRGKLRDVGFSYEKMVYSEKEKIKKLEGIINRLNESSMKVNTLIYGITEDSPILFRESEEDIESYKNILNNIEYKEMNNHNEWIGFNNKAIKLKNSDVLVEVRMPKIEEVESELKKYKSETHYNINITNEISLQLEENDAREYLSHQKFFINVYIGIEFEIVDEVSSGFIFSTY